MAMSTYKAVQLESGPWAIERFANGESQGFMFGRYQDEDAARHMINVFSRMEMQHTAPPPSDAPA